MAFDARNLSLFGLDLGRGWRMVRQGWSDALGWPLFRWFHPVVPVRVQLPDGSTQWRAGASARASSPAKENSIQAVLLPDDLVLFRDLVFPDLVLSDLQQAVALQAREHSPFVADDLAWGWRASEREDGCQDVRLALCSRAHVEKYLLSLDQTAAGSQEIWADLSLPIVIAGFGEARRERACARQRVGMVFSVALLVLMLLSLAAMPFLLKRAQVFDAQARHVLLVNETAQVVADREALLKATARVNAVKAQLQGQVDLPAVLEALTRIFPDTAFLNRFEVSGDRVRIGGFADNAAALVETLGAQAGFRDVRTPSAISRRSDGKESFSVEFIYRNDKNAVVVQ